MHALLVGMAMASFGGQDQPAFHRGLEKSSFKVQLSARSWAECTLEYVFAGKSKLVREEPCTRKCKGEKHFRHVDCDTSCDSPCFQKKHTSVSNAYTTHANYGALESGLTTFGETANLSVVTAFVERRHDQTEDANKVNFNWDHWNETPCSSSFRRAEYDMYLVFFEFALFRHDLTADGRQVLVKGPTGRTQEGELHAPRNEFILNDPIINCACEPSEIDEVPEDMEVGGVFLEGDDGIRPVTDGELAGIGFEVGCSSMTECSATITNPMPGDMTLIINPGTVFDCVDGSAQDEVSCERMEIKLGGGETKTVPLLLESEDIFTTLVQTVKGRFACLNMNKAEPRPGLKYRYGGAAPSDVTALAYKTANSRIKGVPDQVRMWIVTDQATWAQVNKLLIPGPSRGMYVNCLYDVEKSTGKVLTDPEYKACIDPVNIIGSRALPEATDWFVDLWAAHKPAEFRSMLSKNWDALKKDCFDPEGEARDEQHAADLANSLAYSSVPEIRTLAVDCLMKGVPSEKRASIAGMGGLKGISVWLAENDTDLAGKALDVLEAYAHKGTSAALLNCHEELPTPLKERAAALYQAMQN